MSKRKSDVPHASTKIVTWNGVHRALVAHTHKGIEETHLPEGLLSGVTDQKLRDNMCRDIQKLFDDDSDDDGVITPAQRVLRLARSICATSDDSTRQNVTDHAAAFKIPKVNGLGPATAIKLLWLWLKPRVTSGHNPTWVLESTVHPEDTFVRSLVELNLDKWGDGIWGALFRQNPLLINQVQFEALRICWRLRPMTILVTWEEIAYGVDVAIDAEVKEYVLGTSAECYHDSNGTEYIVDSAYKKGVDRLIVVLILMMVVLLTGAGGEGKTYNEISTNDSIVLYLGPRKKNVTDMLELTQRFGRYREGTDRSDSVWPNVATSQRFTRNASYRAAMKDIVAKHEGATKTAFIDEAGLLNAPDLAALLEHLVEIGITHVILAGDEGQGSMWEGGQPFRVLVALIAGGHVKGVTLRTVGRDRVRQVLEPATHRRCMASSATQHNELFYFDQPNVSERVKQLLEEDDIQAFSRTQSGLGNLVTAIQAEPDTDTCHVAYTVLQSANTTNIVGSPEFTRAAHAFCEALENHATVASCGSNNDCVCANYLLFHALSRTGSDDTVLAAMDAMQSSDWSKLKHVPKLHELNLAPICYGNEIGVVVKPARKKDDAVVWTPTKGMFKYNDDVDPFLASTTQKQQGTAYKNSVAILLYYWGAAGKSQMVPASDPRLSGAGSMNVAMTRRRSKLFLVEIRGQPIQSTLSHIYGFTSEDVERGLKRTYEWHILSKLGKT